jgi:hypothetical protein
MDSDARLEEESGERAYGGLLRATKGKLQEYITQELIHAAWVELGGNPTKLRVDSKKYHIPVTDDYIESISNKSVKEHIKSNRENHFYGLSVDKQVYVNGNLVLGAECKAYAEVAMFKRILIDFALLKAFIAPEIACYLVQLESQLGGDFNKCSDSVFGSESVHALQSCFHNITIANRVVDVKVRFVTLLREDRRVKKPIHDPKFFKNIETADLEFALYSFVEGLKDFKK